MHVTLPFVGATQVAQFGPQAATVLLATQVGAAGVPRWQKPGALQTTWQPRLPPVELSQTAIPLAGGAGHAVHDVPQELTLRLDTHGPVLAGQRWNPALQAMPH